MAGVVASGSGDTLSVKLAIPDKEGILMVTDCFHNVKQTDVTTFEGVKRDVKIKRFDSHIDFASNDCKFVEIKNADYVVVDYRDVIFEGYASTFKNVTPIDRQGDYIREGAFSETLEDFKRNPVMLMDHVNSVKYLAGSYEKLGQTKDGLYVRGRVSNAPGLKDIRFLIAEGHLKALSIGGIWLYEGEDYREITKALLYEISLTPVPANQDALFQSRSANIEDMVKAYKMLAKNNKLSFC